MSDHLFIVQCFHNLFTGDPDCRKAGAQQIQQQSEEKGGGKQDRLEKHLESNHCILCQKERLAELEQDNRQDDSDQAPDQSDNQILA